MSVPAAPRRSRRSAALLIAVLAAVIAAVVIIGLVTAGTAGPSKSPTPTVPAVSATPSASASATSSPSSTTTRTPAPTKSAAATPQPTETTAISSAAPIAKSLTAKVTKIEAVKGKANGPGEVAGPAVRFTITITNTTGKTVDLSNTVVNAYYGASRTPASSIEEPGGDPFPTSVANGKTATGVFVFTIATAQRSAVEVTVDTSVRNAVVAFKGSAPKN